MTSYRAAVAEGRQSARAGCLIRWKTYDPGQQPSGKLMEASFSMQDRSDQFAYCVQLFGGTTASSRRLGIDERAIRRFINGERPLSNGLLEDTANALRLLIAEATEAEGQIAAILSSAPNDP
jgi:hypothetical protein